MVTLPGDVIRLMFASMADPIEPKSVLAFAATCRFVRDSLAGKNGEMAKLRILYEGVLALCQTMGCSCHEFRTCRGIFCPARLSAVDIEVLARVARSGALLQLETLEPYNSPFGPAAFSALASALPHLPKLTKLTLVGCALGDESMPILASELKRGVLAKATSINLGHNAIGPRGVDALCKSFDERVLPACSEFAMYGNPLGEEGLTLIAETLTQGSLPALKRLNVAAGACIDVNYSYSGAIAVLKSACDARTAARVQLF